MEIIKELFTPAIGIAISPLPIVGLILILLGDGAKKNSFSYSIGWLVGNLIAFLIGLLFMGTVAGSDGEISLFSKIIYGVLGILLLYLSFRTFSKSIKNKGEINTPKWFDKMTSLNAKGALGLGMALSAVNPKNFLLSLSAGVTAGGITQAALDDVFATFIFALIATSTIVIPTILFNTLGEKINPFLEKLKIWLITNNDSIMAVMFLFIGLKMFGKIF